MIKTYYIFIGLVVLSFLGGRFLTPAKIITETKIEYKEKIVKVVETDKHKKTVIVTKPDGTKTVVVDEDSETRSDTRTDKDKTTEDKKSILNRGTTGISVLVGAQPHMFQGVSLGPIVYGLHVTQEVVGPVTFGLWALSDITAGISIGINF